MKGSWRDAHHPPAEDGFRSLKRLATILTILLGISLLLDLVATLSDLDMLGFLQDAQQGRFGSPQEADQLDSRQTLIGLGQLAMILATGVLFVIWFRRAYRNLGSLGVSWLRFKPGWAVGSWFVPLLGVVRPKEIANDIWRASDPDQPRTMDGPALGARVSPVIDMWWATVLIAGAFARGSLSEPGSDLEALISHARSLLATDLISAVSALLAIAVVHMITARQHQRQARLADLDARDGESEAPDAAPTPPPSMA